MKKTLSILVFLALLLSAFASCKAKPPALFGSLPLEEASSFHGQASFSGEHYSASGDIPKENPESPCPAPKSESSPTPSEDRRPLFERAQYDADFYGFSADARYYVADFDGAEASYAFRKRSGSYLFVRDEQALTDEEMNSEMAYYKSLKGWNEIQERVLFEKEDGVCLIWVEYEFIALQCCPEYTLLLFVDYTDTAMEEYTLSVYRYVQAPLEEYPLIAPEPEPIPVPKTEEEKKSEWLQWLVSVDMGNSYPMIYSGGTYPARYGKESPSPWELWPYNTETKEFSDSSHFHFLLLLDAMEFDAASGIRTEEYPYTWKVYYRKEGDPLFREQQVTPWGAITYGDYYLYRLQFEHYNDFTLAEDGGENVYELIFMIYDENNKMAAFYHEESVAWTNSSELFYNDAVSLGLAPARKGADQ